MTFRDYYNNPLRPNSFYLQASTGTVFKVGKVTDEGYELTSRISPKTHHIDIPLGFCKGLVRILKPEEEARFMLKNSKRRNS